MGDLKLFRIKNEVKELVGTSVAIEKSIQTLIENNMETFFGIKFLASEYPTGKNHGGRIDSLGIDENYCPVILEYKRALNENVSKRLIEQDVKLKYIPFRPAKPFIKCIRYFSSKFLVR